LIGDLYLPNRLELSRRAPGLAMDLAAAKVGGSTVGRLTFGQSVRLVTDVAEHFHVNTPVVGRASSRAGRSEPLATGPGQAAVFAPGTPAEIHWTKDCVQLCVMIPRTTLEGELEELMRRPITRPLEFQFLMDLRTPLGSSWWDALSWVDHGLHGRPSLGLHWLAGRHVERLLLDGLLLGQQHNYSDALDAGPARVVRKPIARAIELLQERPGDPWSSTSLARVVHLSLRSLQEGFKYAVGKPPMAYLRDARLHRIRKELQLALPESTTVQAVAFRWGMVHMSRFSAAYRAQFGEPPSATLRRFPTQG
jgi:AraC-like DNA-binding protein